MALNLALNKDEERRFINVLKGLLAFLVLYGHVIQVFYTDSKGEFWLDPVFECIYSFHMPLFMLISGYLFSFYFKKRELKELIIHRCKPLLFTIVVFGFIKYYIIDAPMAIYNGEISLLTNGLWINNLTKEFWFLWSMIICSVIVSVSFKNIKNLFLRCLVLLVSCCLIIITPLYWLTIFMFPYFLIGFLFFGCKDRLPDILLKLRYISLVAFPLLLCFFEKKHYIYTTGIWVKDYSIAENISIWAFRWVIGLIGSIFVITILLIIFKMKFLQKVFLCLEKLGSYTLQLYVYQVIFLLRLGEVVFKFFFDALGTSNFLLENKLVFHFIIVPIVAVIVSVVFYLLSKWLNKFKFIQTVFGR